MPYIAGVGWVGEDAGQATEAPAPAQSTPQTNTPAETTAPAAETSSGTPPNFNEDRAGWVRHYYGEEYLEDGAYPKGILVDHGGEGGARITGYRVTPETHPWLFPGPGDVHTNGKVYPEQSTAYDGQGGFFKGFDASPEEIKASHDRRNYFRNGAQGLDPNLVRTMVDNRRPDSPYWQRMHANAGKPPDQRPYPSPEEVTGPYGRYYYQRQNFVKSPHVRGRDHEVGYRPSGVTPSRFVSNGQAYTPGQAPTAPAPDTSAPATPPATTNPEPPSPPPTTEPVDRTGPVTPGNPGVTITPTGSGGASPEAPNTPDPMAAVQGQGSGLLSTAAQPAAPAPSAPAPGGTLARAQTAAEPQKGMFGT